MQVHFINTYDSLAQICQKFSSSQFLALDTEFIRETTYYPILALVQICDGKQIAIIDPVEIKDLSPLKDLLYQTHITKVLHSAYQDMEIFYHLNQSVPDTLFDTQICAALLGYGEQIGYATLVKQLLNVSLDKSQTRTNWLKRPLTQKQIDYAANDVCYLAQLYPLMQQKLQQLSRQHWLDNDFLNLSNSSTYAPTPETIWRKIKGINHLKKQQLAILQKLAAFREQLAIKLNRPRRRVFSDDILIELAVNPVHNKEDLNQHKALGKQILFHNAETLLSLIEQGLNTADIDCPHLPQYKNLSQNEQALSDCLMAIVHLSAKENNISPHYLCSKKTLEAFIKDDSNVNILKGWRNELIGRKLKQFIQGKAHLRYISGQLTLAIEEEFPNL